MTVTFPIVLSVPLLAVAIFALENAQLFGFASRLPRWTRGRAATGAARPPALPSGS